MALTLTRRRMLAGTAALALPGTLRAQSRWEAVASQARRLDQCHCLVIAHRGEVVLAEAFRGPAPDRPVNVKSVSKTVVAAVLGAAIDRGEVSGLGASLGDVAPRLIPPGADPRVASLTMEQLVTMTAGLERTSGANYGGWVQSRDWVANALSRPFVAAPGSRMLYSTGSFHILGAALAEAAGTSLLSLTRDWLGRPLGITVPAWPADPQGRYFGGNEMRLAPLDMVRFGEMYRLGGTWAGRQVLPADWVEASFQARTRSPWSGMGYGLGWFLARADRTDYALARGYGGQIIFVAPARELTVAITSDPTRPARSEGYFGVLRALLEDDLLPAARV